MQVLRGQGRILSSGAITLPTLLSIGCRIFRTGMAEPICLILPLIREKNIQIALGIDARNNDNRLHIDNVNLYVANSFCPGIRAVEKKAVSATSATLNILLNDSALQWQFAYGPTGFIFTDKTVITTIDTTEFTITGLSAHTAYDVYARSICAVGDTSAWSKPYTFATAYVVPFKETFEDMATVLFPAEWTRYKKAIAYDDLISGKASFQNNYALRINRSI